jgi:glutamate carboxypeptidase
LADKTICVAQNSDEEISSVYSRAWLEELSKRSRLVFVLEGARSEGVLVNQRKGVGRFPIEFKGVAAHSGVDPENGRSAIGEMGHWIVALHALTDFDIGTTVNVGVVSGGSVPNMVADRAQARVDMRFREISEAVRVEAAINRLAKNPSIQGVHAEVTGGVTRPPMNPSEKTLDICKQIDAIGDKLRVPIKWVGTGGGSDGNFSAALGVPTLDGLGPAGGRYHSTEEFLEIDTIEPHHRLLKEMIKQIKV